MKVQRLDSERQTTAKVTSNKTCFLADFTGRTHPRIFKRIGTKVVCRFLRVDKIESPRK